MEQRKFIKAIQGHKLEMLFLIALSTGLRLGELLSLKWIDINFEDGNLTVNRTIQRVTQISKDGTRISKLIEQDPKTKNSNRTVPIPKDILTKLKLHKKEQSKHKLYVGEIYNNKNYIFADELGNPIDDKRPGRNLKNKLLDHIIIGSNDSYFSFKENLLM
ncbi:site-specific integrase [Romboutsia sp. 1001713B170131_170501_G6]|uniref:site-specific integrase n=1 Tax=Romboutsia sp. 1001713B170131_170501_G6 TaxID=2787108 RepID=UPI0018A9941B|nr:site-specific integrase [Romboutsia sp. 1001713B170131_170501_G6]